MKLYSNILSFVIGILALPISSIGQCLTLSEPLLLQAPDSICAEKKELVIKTSRAKETGAKYFCRTPKKNTIKMN